MNPPDTPPAAPIFLNYRKEDSNDAATRLYDELVSAMGEDKVFIDRGMPSGSRWPQVLRDRVKEATVVIVVIGRDWLSAHDLRSHQRRLDADDDWVRVEIEEALRAQKVVIPVLVRDAVWPRPEDFPPSIRELANFQTITISAENWRPGFNRLLKELAMHGLQQAENPQHPPTHSEPSFLGVIDYFYRQIGHAASGEHPHLGPSPKVVHCTGMSNLWASVEDLLMQKHPPYVHIRGQLTPYAPLLCGNPLFKRQLHLELRQGARELVNTLGFEFGDLLNGLLSYSAGQMVIRPYFQSNYAFLGLCESIVRNSIPVMIEREYYQATLLPLFRSGINCLEVHLQGFLAPIPNYTQAALNHFGIMEHLSSVLDVETLKGIGQPNCAIFVQGDTHSFVKVPEEHRDHPHSSRYLDGDVWVANAANSLITRFIDISSRDEMHQAVNQINSELRKSMSGRGILSSFDVRMAKIEDQLPDRVLSAAQLPPEPGQSD